MPGFFDLLKRFRRDERGVFGVIFALLAVVLVAVSGCVVDFSYMQTTRSRAQTALDSAALALQAKMGTMTDDQIKTDAQNLLIERLADGRVTAQVDSVTRNVDAGTLDLNAQITVPTAFVQLVGITTLSSKLRSEVTQSSNNLEVSIALDLTTSMTIPNTKIEALKTATGNIIDLLVKDNQTPTYSRMAFAPYSYGVNASTYVTSVRGTPVGGTPIIGAVWKTTTAPNISGITRANPAVVTVNSVTGLANGDYVGITGVNGMTQVNNKAFKIAGLDTNNKKFQLSGVNSTNYNSYSNGGTATKCQIANCEVTVTSNSHGLATGEKVYIVNVGGMTQINAAWTVGAVTTNTFVLTGSVGPGYGTYSSNTGTAYCAKYGCSYINFTNKDGANKTFAVSANCVTERTIYPHQYDDAAPGPGSPLPAPVSFMYPSSTSNCVTSPIVPLTDDKTRLHDVASHLVASGSTAGHIGLAWAWYLLSPNFGYLFSGDNDLPAKTYSGDSYGKANLVKAVILMTDGLFNSQYCNGVISNDSDTVSGTANMINCNSPNGTSVNQAKALCAAIKDSGGPRHNTILYTVGFDIGSNSNDDKNARSFLSGCATDPEHFYQADSADDLDNAFKSIAKNLSELRLSK